jgi:hypothetical protein
MKYKLQFNNIDVNYKYIKYQNFNKNEKVKIITSDTSRKCKNLTALHLSNIQHIQLIQIQTI